jgi:phosphoglycerate dehydrogenase-like enzyme
MRILNQAGRYVRVAVQAAFPEAEVIDVPAHGPVPDDAMGDVLIAGHLTPNVGVLASRVGWVHAVGAGIDGMPAEVFACPIVTCGRGATATPISEYVLLAMLAAEKDIDRLWIREPAVDPYGTPLGGLDGRRLGLVGFGGIGRAVAQRASPFGMDIRTFRRTAQPPDLAGVEATTDLPGMVAWADHLVIAAPATAATHHLIGAQVLADADPGLHLVNVARGSLVDHDALRVALDDGRVGRATLDVTDPEPLPAGHWLYDHPHVRVSPHFSWSSPRHRTLVTDHVVANLRRWQAGEPLHGHVDPDAGY